MMIQQLKLALSHTDVSSLEQYREHVNFFVSLIKLDARTL